MAVTAITVRDVDTWQRVVEYWGNDGVIQIRVETIRPHHAQILYPQLLDCTPQAARVMAEMLLIAARVAEDMTNQ